MVVLKVSWCGISAWNVFDFVLILSIWLSITASRLLDLDDDAGFALSVLRTLRLMRFFAGIRELMAAVALGYKSLLTILGVALYDSTFSRTVWRLCGGAKGLAMWY
jgi:hypothetical protein